jgi:hypothetical protein
MENPTQRVRIRVGNITLLKRVRKAVWKEKDLDKQNCKKYRLNIEFVKDEKEQYTGEIIFKVVLTNSVENI